jgi:hypothetical protein
MLLHEGEETFISWLMLCTRVDLNLRSDFRDGSISYCAQRRAVVGDQRAFRVGGIPLEGEERNKKHTTLVDVAFIIFFFFFFFGLPLQQFRRMPCKSERPLLQ